MTLGGVRDPAEIKMNTAMGATLAYMVEEANDRTHCEGEPVPGRKTPKILGQNFGPKFGPFKRVIQTGRSEKKNGEKLLKGKKNKETAIIWQ